jgi:hemin uptake protein HemP
MPPIPPQQGGWRVFKDSWNNKHFFGGHLKNNISFLDTVATAKRGGVMSSRRQIIEQEAGTERQLKNNRRVISSKTLLGSERELNIEHAGEEYRLRITSNRKLILTK